MIIRENQRKITEIIEEHKGSHYFQHFASACFITINAVRNNGYLPIQAYIESKQIDSSSERKESGKFISKLFKISPCSKEQNSREVMTATREIQEVLKFAERLLKGYGSNRQSKLFTS